MSIKHSVTVKSGDLMGENTPNQLFIHKLEERIGYERSATQIYEALRKKIEQENQETEFLEQLKKFQLEEFRHGQLLTGVRNMFIENNGLSFDIPVLPTSVWVKVIEEPGTSIADSVEALMQLELVDNGAWELLVELAEKIGLPEVAIQFQQALNAEEEHLRVIKQWAQDLQLSEVRH